MNSHLKVIVIFMITSLRFMTLFIVRLFDRGPQVSLMDTVSGLMLVPYIVYTDMPVILTTRVFLSPLWITLNIGI
jgi:hypothetical protein